MLFWKILKRPCGTAKTHLVLYKVPGTYFQYNSDFIVSVNMKSHDGYSHFEAGAFAEAMYFKWSDLDQFNKGVEDNGCFISWRYRDGGASVDGYSHLVDEEGIFSRFRLKHKSGELPVVNGVQIMNKNSTVAADICKFTFNGVMKREDTQDWGLAVLFGEVGENIVEMEVSFIGAYDP